MRVLAFISILLGFTFLFSCAEEAPVHRAQKVRIWSDYFNESDGEFFRTFERKHRITVEIKNMDAKTIEKRLQQEGLNAPVDVLLLSNALSSGRLANQDKLYTPKGFDLSWSSLIIEPLVFSFDLKHDLEKYPLNAYSEWLESDYWLVDTSKLDALDYKTLKLGMRDLYGLKHDSLWQERVYDPSKKLRYGKKIFQLQWLGDAQQDTLVKFIIPNQREGGAISRTLNLAIVNHAFNTKAAILFREYCENPKWKRWMAVRKKQWVYPLASRQPIQKKKLHVVLP